MKYISEDLWRKIEQLISHKRSKVGRPEFDNKRAFHGILFVLKTGAHWHELPEKYGCPSTVHGKFMRWCRNGVFAKMLIKCREYYRIRNSKNNWYAFDTISRKAPLAQFGGKSPVDRAKQGIKYGLLVDRKGAPLFVTVASGNTHDSKLFEPAIRPLRKSKKTRIIAADSAFDIKHLRSVAKAKNIALIAAPNSRRKKNVHKFVVPYRWIVEQTFGILSWSRGIKTCWSKTYEACLGLVQLACSFRLLRMSGIFV
jgi:transposase